MARSDNTKQHFIENRGVFSNASARRVTSCSFSKREHSPERPRVRRVSDMERYLIASYRALLLLKLSQRISTDSDQIVHLPRMARVLVYPLDSPETVEGKRVCKGWSESSLVAQVLFQVLICVGSISFERNFIVAFNLKWKVLKMYLFAIFTRHLVL